MNIRDIYKNKLILITVLVLIVVVILYFCLADNSKDENITVIHENEKEVEEMVIVHISGQIRKPGVIELKKGQRLYEAIEIAGGTSEDADVDKINLAMILEDQQKIIVPSIKENDTTAQDDGAININTADIRQLMELPGIGEKIAESIVQYREDNNGFKNIEEIKNVHRIGDATFEKLKDKITVY